MDFNRYFNNDEIEELVNHWAKTYPHICSLSTIGMSHEQRPIRLIILTNHATGADTSKPALWIDANLHATEIAGTTTALYIAHNLLVNYNNDDRITRLLDHNTIYILPRVNPDGAALAMAPIPQYIRSGVRPYPWNEKDEGLHVQDINGDGHIRQMRIKDPYGDWKISSLDPRLMEKRGPLDFGAEYFRLLPEGLIENYDGYLIKVSRPVQGLDFNRNFPFEWRSESEQSGAGPFPTSESEIRALVNFVTGHPNINLAITFHTFSRAILRPYSTRPDDEMATDDLWVYQKIGEIGTKITGYRCVSTFHDFKYHPKEVTTGAFDDWIFDHLGIFSFTIELWDLPTEAGIKDRKFIDWWREHPHEDDLQILKWIEENVGTEGYQDWQIYEHPQLGTLELGGWDSMYTWRNPPPSWMEKEASLHYPFMLALTDLLPHLTIHTLDVKAISADAYAVNLVVENSGYLPTYTSEQGKKRQAMRPPRVEIELPVGGILKSGKERLELGHLEGRSNKLSVAATYAASPTDNRARAEWVIQATPGSTIKLRIMSERAGEIQRTITLE